MQTEELSMFSPTLLSKIHELTNNSSVETFVIVGAQADSTLLMLVSVSTRFDSGLMFKELEAMRHLTPPCRPPRLSQARLRFMKRFRS